MKNLKHIIAPAVLPYLWYAVISATLWKGKITFFGNYTPLFLVLFILGTYAVCISLTVISCIVLLNNGTSSRTIAGLTLVLKLVHIVAYVLFFSLGALLFIWIIGIGFWLLNFLLIATSGILGTASMLKGRLEGKLATASAVIRSIISFVFIIDVLFAVINYIKLRKNKKYLQE